MAGNSAAFNFGSEGAASKENESVIKVNPTSPVKEDDATLDQPYYDERTISISPVRNYSLYRKANDKLMPARTDMIGSSITSSRVLCANKAEMDAYMPNILGLSSNDPDFVRRVKMYFNNIQIPINNLGKKLNTGFHYYKKSDYISFKNREDANAVADEIKKTFPSYSKEIHVVRQRMKIDD